MKIATRSIELRPGEIDVAIARAIIEAFQHAWRSMPFPRLTGIEKRVAGYDVQFMLTFEPMQPERRVSTNAVGYRWVVSEKP